MIDEKFKIIFFNGGFAGDLITALHNPLTFNRFSNRKIVLADGFYKLKSHTYRTETPIEEKIKYIKSIEHYGVCSSHDMEFSLKFRENTQLVYCSDDTMTRTFFDRINRTHKHHMIMSFEEHLAWQVSSRSIFKNQIDLAGIGKPGFLQKINIKNEKSKEIYEEWLERNKLN